MKMLPSTAFSASMSCGTSRPGLATAVLLRHPAPLTELLKRFPDVRRRRSALDAIVQQRLGSLARPVHLADLQELADWRQVVGDVLRRPRDGPVEHVDLQPLLAAQDLPPQCQQ